MRMPSNIAGSGIIVELKHNVLLEKIMGLEMPGCASIIHGTFCFPDWLLVSHSPC